MTFEEFGKFLNRTLLLSMDRISGPRLVRFAYILGLAVAAIWGLNHLFATFRAGFGDGLWGLLEVAMFGLFGITLLRVVCEALIVYFEANKDAMQTASRPEGQTSLIDEVRDAIEQLGDEEDDKAPARIEAETPAKPAAAKPAAAKSATAKSASAAKSTTAKRASPTRRTPRTAKRSPKPKAGTGEG